MSYDEVQAIVIDNGSGLIKAGFAGDDEPRTILSNTVCQMRSSTDAFRVGAAWSDQEIQSIRYPIEHGIITSWDDMENIWHHIFHNELHTSPEEHPVLITEAPFNPKGNREKTVQILFERFSVPATYIINQAVLSFYAMGRTSGVILEMGDGVIHTVPIFEGYASTSAIHRIDFAGRDLTDCLIQLLAERGYAFTTTVGREIVRDIKEKLGYVALNYDEELQKSPSSHGIEKIYTLPDGQQITIGNERFRCAEALFAPRQFGYDEPSVAQMLYSTIMKGEIDTRKDFYCNCLLAGGTSKFAGLPERLTKEMISLISPSARVRVVSWPDRGHSVWVGGSILGSLSTFQTMWISREQYNEFGPSILHRLCS